MASNASQIQVKIRKPWRISPPGQRHWFPGLIKMSGGSLVQTNSVVDDETRAIEQPNPLVGRLSSNGGNTWQNFPIPDFAVGVVIVLPSDKLRGLSYHLYQREDRHL